MVANSEPQDSKRNPSERRQVAKEVHCGQKRTPRTRAISQQQSNTNGEHYGQSKARRDAKERSYQIIKKTPRLNLFPKPSYDRLRRRKLRLRKQLKLRYQNPQSNNDY